MMDVDATSDAVSEASDRETAFPPIWVSHVLEVTMPEGQPSDENQTDAPEPMNRAERRAQKKGKQAQQGAHHPEQKIQPHGSNQGPSARIWNRKSG